MGDLAVLEARTFEDGQLFHTRKGKVCPLPYATAPLADTHGHLTCLAGHDPAEALCRSALAGVHLLVVPVDPVDEIPRKWKSVQELLGWIDRQIERASRLMGRFLEAGLSVPETPGWKAPDLLENVHIVAGVHPYGAHELDGAALKRLEELLDSPRCVGVGEIGLDFGPYNDVAVSVQEAAFRVQLRIAGERDLPVELHIRDAPDDELASAHHLAERVLGEEGVPRAGCDLHCFTQGPAVMEPFVRLGCHIAFGGVATFAHSDDVRAAATACPEGLILSETDAPYMAPAPLRGQECEPAMVAISAARVVEVREQAGAGAATSTYAAFWQNACNLFSFGSGRMVS